MGGLFEQVKAFVQRDDLVETIVLFLQEHYELALVAIAIIFIFVLSLSTILQRLRKSSWIALVPIYRFVVLFKATGISPWYAILMLIPGVNLIMRVVFYVALVRKFNRNYFFVFLLTVLPLIFLPVVAFGDGHYIYIKRVKRPKEEKARFARSAQKEKGGTSSSSIKNTQVEKVDTQSKVAPKAQHEYAAPALSMAEIRKQRAKAHIDRLNAKLESSRKMQAQTASQIRAKKLVQASKTMPEMQMGPKSRNINAQVKKASEMTNEYERLLREQEARQRRRQQVLRQARKSVINPAVKKSIAINDVAKRPLGAVKVITKQSKPVAINSPVRKVTPKPRANQTNPHGIKINFS